MIRFLFLHRWVPGHGVCHLRSGRVVNRSILRTFRSSPCWGCYCHLLCVLQSFAKMGDVLIPELRVGECTDRICVRASRFWEFYDINDETKLLHADLVLIDEEGNSIHAQIYPSAYPRFKPLIKEGSVYNLDSFWVKKSNDNYKPVTNHIMLTLSTWTTIEEVVEIPPAFPCLTYSLTPIEELPSRQGYTEYFTDVIGIVTTVLDVLTLRARGRQSESLKRIVTLHNGSNASVDVVLWGERASSFPAEQIQTDGQASPQVVIFVGTLVKKYFNSDGISLAGNAPCKWYINPEVPEAKALLSSIGDMNQPIKWDKQMVPSKPVATVEEKTVSEIMKLNPFKTKKMEFLITVTIKQIDRSWWYNACSRCSRTTKPYGNLYKCSEPTCDYVGKPVQRYKLTMIAGDETGDTNFIMFGKFVQRLINKSVVMLIAENPHDFIPNEITRLLEKTFKWNVSFTQNTLSSSKVCFQVNDVVGRISDTDSILPVTPTASQSSSLMSQSAGSSIQRTPQKSVAFRSPSKTDILLATHASSATPTKNPLSIPETHLTPQSRRYLEDSDDDQISPTKKGGVPIEQAIEPINEPSAETETPHGDDDIIVSKSDANPSGSKDVAADSATKNQKSVSRKRSRSSPNKKIAKKLILGEATVDEDDSGCADHTAKPSSSADV